ncbi:sigma-70 region 4 domain-containing protein [Chryseobacterium jejuense]|uniref:sigma-70 region 4 domain-containing protein n=1 Tax=Chryseobacterium jejuense TaxID=445960 RepID=UPI001AE51601|nr:sigma-70 region 4 domain-containing protein [Chryseobacterium jejuense]MBP2618855.1 hypothetical protein [Chryseobacterium jejuense]
MIKTIDFHIRTFFIVLLCFHFGNIQAQEKGSSRVLLEKERDKILVNGLDNPNEALMKLQDLQNRALKVEDLYFANNCEAIKALIYYNISDYPKALEYGKKAMEEARSNHYMDIESIAMGIVGMQYSKVGLKEEAIMMGKKAMTLAESNNSPDYIAAQYKVSIYYNQILNECDFEKYKLEMLELDKKTLLLAKKLNNRQYIRNALINITADYVANKMYEEAKKVNRQLLKNYIGESDYSDMVLYDRAGNLYIGTRQSDSAIYYLYKGLYLSKKLNLPEDKSNFLRQLKEAYRLEGNSEKNENIDKEYTNIVDQQSYKKKEALQTSVKNIINENQKKQERKTNFFKTTALISFIAIIFLSVVYYIYYTRFKRQKLSVEAQQKTIKEKQESIQQLQSQLKKHNTLDDIIQYAVEDNPVFLKRYKEIYPDFFEKLYSLSSELTIDDLKCCAMLHLHFSTKEIASYTHTSIRTIENRKFRIRKKINMQDSQKDLNEFLISL